MPLLVLVAIVFTLLAVKAFLIPFSTGSSMKRSSVTGTSVECETPSPPSPPLTDAQIEEALHMRTAKAQRCKDAVKTYLRVYFKT